MGRPVSTGKSHDKKAITYRSKQGNKASKSSGKQTTLTNLFKTSLPKENQMNDEEAGPSNLNVTELELEASSITDNDGDSDGSHATDECVNESAKLDGRSYLAWHKSQQKWESLYPCLFYSASKQGWLCNICGEYSVHGDAFWRTEAVKMEEHPGRLFSGHIKSNKHSNALKRQQETKQLLKQGSIYKQLRSGLHTQALKTKRRNCAVIKKFLKTTYFVARKKWAVRENFPDIIHFLKGLGDEVVFYHLQQASSRASYISTTSTDEFLKCLSRPSREWFFRSFNCSF